MTNEHPRRFIWFCNTEFVAENPDSLKKLRDEIGLTTIMPESHICHTSGFRASDEIIARSPFEDWRERKELWPRGQEGIYPVVAGTVGGFDDAPLLKVIGAAREAGIEIWGHLGLWSYGGDAYPEYAMRDIEGNLLDDRYKRWGIGLCPSNRMINEWTRDCLIDVIGRYDIDGFNVDHARFPAPANVSSLFACGCEHCEEEAERLGFDFQQMKDGLLKLKGNLSRLKKEDVTRASKANLGLWDFLSLLADDYQVSEWLNFRAVLLAERMKEFRDAVREASGPDKVFGSDVWPPSIAFLGGHIYSEWEKGSDYLTGGSSAGGVVGWATTVTNLAAEWATFLCETVDGLDEKDALRLIFRMFGFEDLELPDSVEGIRGGPLPIVEIYEREVRKLKAVASGNVPLYPPISVSGEPESVRRLCTVIVENECDGALFGVNPDSDELLEVVREVFKV